MTPARYRAGGAGESIRWSLRRHRAGHTRWWRRRERGICMVELGADAHGAGSEAAARNSRVRNCSASTPGATNSSRRACMRSPRGWPGRRRVDGWPVDLIGTAFQKKVWDALMRIPLGETRSYAAACVRNWAAARRRARSPAPARTIASPILVPCHRVIRGDGSLGGYRWGLPLKQQLLQRERARGQRFRRRRGDCRVGSVSPSLTVSNTIRVS